MDRVTKAKIDSLLYELRSWGTEEKRVSADALAERYRLDPMLVRRIAQGEGIELGDDEHDEDVDPNQVTAVMSFDEIDLR